MHNPLKQLFVTGLALMASSAGAEIAPDDCSNPALQPATPSHVFQALGDGSEVRDTRTGLVWKRCAFGQSWDGSSCSGFPSNRNWAAALAVAVNAGEGWRLPSVRELQSIVEFCRHDPAINLQVFPNTFTFDVWTSSPYVGLPGGALVVDFQNGRSSWSNKGINRSVRLVRGGR